jgi:DNA polymerase-3 subunit alpha
MDGIGTAQEYSERMDALGMPAAAITDHGTLAGWRDWHAAMLAKGIKPILGVEAYYTHDRFDRRERKDRGPLDKIYNHLTVLAKNARGAENISRMSESAWTDGFFHKPRIDWALLEEFGDDLIIGSACMSGVLNKAIELGDFQVAKDYAIRFKDRFGDNYYIEIMPHNPPGMNQMLLQLADSLDIKVIVTPDCHHVDPSQAEIQEFALILSTHQRPRKGVTYSASCNCGSMMERLDYLYGADRPMSFRDFDIHLLSYEEMRAAMEAEGIHRTDIYENTLAVADQVEVFEMPKGLDLLPVEYANPDKTLRNYALQGLKDRGLTDKVYLDRLDEELGVIAAKSFANYFLMVRTITSYAKKRGILMSPGRGSAAGSLVTYALGITNVDPIKHNLLFFRFIDVSRDDMPDIDMDFQDSRRDEVKRFIARKYGDVASIATFMTFGDKTVIRDVSRVLNIPLDRVNAALKCVNDWDSFMSSDHPTVVAFRRDYPEVIKYSQQLHGRIRGTGVHPAGVVASKVPLNTIAPIETRKAGEGDRLLVVAVDKNNAAEIGLDKVDILGLKTLSVIRDTLDLIEERHGVTIDLNEIDLNDPAALELLNSGKTKGIFQCEAGPYTKLILDMVITSFDELVASNALVRPGAANTIGKEYIARKKRLRSIKYPHSSVKPYLEDTYGCVLYQEQVMQLCVTLGGMTMAEANKVRKIIGQKKDVTEFDAFKAKFVANAGDIIGTAQAEKLWHDFEAHAGYSFNKSHAVAYSMLSMWTAYLKAHYPIEFFQALLSNEKERDSVTDYLIDAKRMGLTIKFPHVNTSGLSWSIVGDAIQFGLTNIKYISDASASRLIKARPFKSYQDLAEFVGTKGSGVNSRALDSMRSIGAANFKDFSVDSTVQANSVYEILGVPTFNVDLPTHWGAKITQIADYDEGDTAIVNCFVRSVKTGTGWELYQGVDSTGSLSFFGRPGVDIEVGKAYLLVIAEKAVVMALDSSELDGTTALEKYLDTSTEDGFVVATRSRRTRAGKLMGTIVADIGGELVAATLFPSNFAQVAPKIKAGMTYNLDIKPLMDGGNVLNGIAKP